MAEEVKYTEEQQEELNAAMYNVKYSSDEIKAKEGAKLILNHHMDIGGIRTILTKMQTETLNAKDSGGYGDAIASAQVSFINVIAELFVNSLRMGMLEQQNEYRKLIQEIKSKAPLETIGTPAPTELDENT